MYTVDPTIVAQILTVCAIILAGTIGSDMIRDYGRSRNLRNSENPF